MLKEARDASVDAQQVVSDMASVACRLQSPLAQVIRRTIPSDPMVRRAAYLAREIMYTSASEFLPHSIRPFVLQGKRLQRPRPGVPPALTIVEEPHDGSFGTPLMPKERIVTELARLNPSLFALNAAEVRRLRARVALPRSAMLRVHATLKRLLKGGVPRHVRHRCVTIPSISQHQMRAIRRYLSHCELAPRAGSKVESTNAALVNALFRNDVFPFEDSRGGRVVLTKGAKNIITFDDRNGAIRLALHLSYERNGVEMWSTAESQWERMVAPVPQVYVEYNPALVLHR